MIVKISRLKKLYSNLISNIAEYKGEVCPFFVQVGKKYYSAPIKIIFIGKATNGWVTDELDVDKLFDKYNPDRIVNRHDQLEWVHDLEGKNDVYNTKKSAFWRVIKNIALDFIGEDDWYNYIAWSNLYKIAPWEGGNPNGFLQDLQRETCISILNEEKEILKPDVIVYLTSDWERFYLDSLGVEQKKNQKKTWGKYTSYFQKVDGTLFIQSCHPQGKPECDHYSTIVEILKESFPK